MYHQNMGKLDQALFTRYLGIVSSVDSYIRIMYDMYSKVCPAHHMPKTQYRQIAMYNSFGTTGLRPVGEWMLQRLGSTT